MPRLNLEISADDQTYEKLRHYPFFQFDIFGLIVAFLPAFFLALKNWKTLTIK